MGDDTEESSTDEAALDQSHAASTPVAQATLFERARAASEAGHPILTIVVFWLALIWGLAFYIRGYHSYGRWEPWNVGDWLIGYQGGFVRRGLIGQVVFDLGRHGPKIPPPASIFFLQVVLVLLSAIGITLLAKAKRDRWLPWMVLSPAGLLFFITNRRFIVTSKIGSTILKNYGAGGMRKEILLFVIVVALALAIGRSRRTRWILLGLALVAYLVEMLSWEAAAFFLPILFVLLAAALRDETRDLRDGLWHHGVEIEDDEVALCFYGDLFRRQPGSERDAELEQSRAGIEEAMSGLAGGDALEALSQAANTAAFDRTIDLVNVITNDPDLRGELRGRIEPLVGDDTTVLIAHSLGTLLSYMAIANHPGWPIKTFVTLGSPLAAPMIFQSLDPSPVDGVGVWPGSVERWINIRAVGDKAAAVPLSKRFGERVEDVLVDNGHRAHDPEPYLNAVATGGVVAEALRG